MIGDRSRWSLLTMLRSKIQGGNYSLFSDDDFEFFLFFFTKRVSQSQLSFVAEGDF